MYKAIDNGFRCSWAGDRAPLARKITGTVSIILGIAMVALACTLACGVLGGGKYYYIGAGFSVGALIPLLTGSKILSISDSRTVTTGGPNTVTKDPEDLDSTDT